MDEEIRLRAREGLRKMPEEERRRLVEDARQMVLDANPGTPPAEIRVEGLGLDALAEEIVVRYIARLCGDWNAQLREHVVEEDYRRWMAEEMRRLAPHYPGGAVPDDVLVDAVRERLEEERPQLRPRR